MLYILEYTAKFHKELSGHKEHGKAVSVFIIYFFSVFLQMLSWLFLHVSDGFAHDIAQLWGLCSDKDKY